MLELEPGVSLKDLIGVLAVFNTGAVYEVIAARSDGAGGAIQTVVPTRPRFR